MTTFNPSRMAASAQGASKKSAVDCYSTWNLSSTIVREGGLEGTWGETALSLVDPTTTVLAVADGMAAGYKATHTSFANRSGWASSINWLGRQAFMADLISKATYGSVRSVGDFASKYVTPIGVVFLAYNSSIAVQCGSGVL